MTTKPIKVDTKEGNMEKEIFNMVYQWGRVGVRVDYTNPVYQHAMGLLELENMWQFMLWFEKYGDYLNSKDLLETMYSDKKKRVDELL